MKSEDVLRFSVRGNTREELVERVRQTVNEYYGDPQTPGPSGIVTSFIVEEEPNSVLQTANGRWYARVEAEEY